MAENDDESAVHYDDEEQEGGLYRWMSGLVVLLAVAGFFSLAWYAYKSGGDAVDEKDVELVKADKTPVKEAPANPGGMDIPNQDKTVYGLINGGHNEKPTVERVLPAPEEPVARAGNTDTQTWMSDKAKNKVSGSEDASASPSPAAPVQTQAAEEYKEQFNPDKIRAPRAPEKQMADAAPAANAPVIPEKHADPDADKGDSPAAPVLTGKVTALPAAPVVPSAPAVAPAPPAPAIKNAPPAVAAPKAAAVKKAPGAQESQEQADDEPPAATAPPTGARVQLGAYKSQNEANANWARIRKKFSDDIGGRQHYVIRADLGDKGVFYRLQMGPFASGREAEQFCLDFVSAGQGCFLAKAK